MDIATQLNKMKNKRYLILSAGGPQSGIQGIYINVEATSWSMLSHSLIPYPQRVGQAIDSIMQTPSAPLTIDVIGKLDFKISQLFLECAKNMYAAAQKSLQQPHVIVLNKLCPWKEPQKDASQAAFWNLELGDAQLLASWFKTPVLTDFVRHGILGGKSGEVPLFPGISKIKAADKEGIIAHCTIGMMAHLFIFDTHANHIIIDTDTGPGTCLINKAALDTQSPDRFDRDGSISAQGTVDAACLDALAGQEWFVSPTPRQATLSALTKLYDHPCMARSAPRDKLATLTALTARTVFDVYKRDYRHAVQPETMWISGGGANNLTLLDFLATYFAPLPVKRIDETGIPAELFYPLALGLTVDTFYTGGKQQKSGTAPEIEGIGTWIWP